MVRSVLRPVLAGLAVATAVAAGPTLVAGWRAVGSSSPEAPAQGPAGSVPGVGEELEVGAESGATAFGVGRTSGIGPASGAGPASHAAPGSGRVGPFGSPGPGQGSPTTASAARPGSSGSSSDGVHARWRWPVDPRPAVLRPFRAPESPYGPGHRGLDLAAQDGTAVLAVEAGTVTHAGVVAGRGTVTVEHAGGLRSTYEPVAVAVRAGTVVAAGDVLGTLRARDGPAHCGLRPCLHLGALRGRAYLDPYPLLVTGRLALLPLR